MATDWQIEIDSGSPGAYLIGDGTPTVLRSFSGLTGSAPVRAGSLPKEGADGDFPGVDYSEARTVIFDVIVTGADQPTLETNLEALRRVCAPAGRRPEYQVVFKQSGQPERMFEARCREYRPSRSTETQGGRFAPVRIRFDASNPRILSKELISQMVSLQTSAGGIVLPATLPWSLASSEAGLISAPNDGSYPATWTARVDGPVTSPRILHVEQSAAIEVDLVVAAGDFLAINSYDRTILLNGTASRYGQLTAASVWFGLDPGPNSIQYSAAAGTGTLRFDYRHSWN